MLLTRLADKLRALKAPILVVGLSALIAFLITVATRPDAAVHPAAAAGQAGLALLQDEHALVDDYARGQREAERAAAERSRAEMRQANAVAEAPPLAAVVPVPVSKPLPVVRVAAAADPVQAGVAAIAGPPLQLQAPMPPAEKPRSGVVIERAREALVTVQRIPHWVGKGVRDAANWAILGPVQTITRLPERRFL